MDKPVITKEQAEALETAIDEYGKDDVLNDHITFYPNFENWANELESLNELKPHVLARALYIGYEVKPEVVEAPEGLVQMSKERLEEIKQHQYDGYTIWDMSEDDLIWLIEQAEIVEELNERIKYSSRYIGKLHLFLQRRNLPPKMLGKHVINVVIEYVKELENQIYQDDRQGMLEDLYAENKRYKQALEFYAERDNYQWEVSYRPQQEIDCMVIDDSGYTARKALEGEE